MKIRASNKLIIAVSAILLVSSQSTMLLAADGKESGSAPVETGSYPPPPPGGWDSVVDSLDKQMDKQNSASQQQGTTQSYAQQSGAAQPQQQPRSAQSGVARPQQPRSAQSGVARPQQLPRSAQSGVAQPQQLPRSAQSGAARPQQPRSAQAYGAPGFRAPQQYRRPYGGRHDYGRGRSSGPGFGPWDSGHRGRRGNDSSMPWGGSSMPWSSKKGKKGSGGWWDKDDIADAWDDMLNAPSDMGELPGGFYAPSVSVPNPVDVGDEFDDAARDVPGQMRNVYEDNRRNNSDYRYDRYDSYDRGRYDRYRR